MKLLAALGAAFAVYLVVMSIAIGSVLGAGGDSASQVLSGSFVVGAHPAGLSPEALRNVEIALRVAEREHAPDLAVTAELVGGLGESHFLAIPNGQGSGYCGVFQADPRNIACDDTESQATHFLLGGEGFQAGGAIHLAVTQPSLTPGAIATLVEASGQPASFYDVHFSEAQQILAAWRAGSVSGDPKAGAGGAVGDPGSDWLATVPGTSFQCDRRIVGDVVHIIERWGVQLTACYAPTGHETGGEHPLGLAVDLVPAPPATWGMMAALARWAGWRPACADTGCASQTGTAFRFVGYNNYPGHGDPAHAGANAHLHLSWTWRGDRGPPAASVQTLTG
jgi:hypothetical protein